MIAWSHSSYECVWTKAEYGVMDARVSPVRIADCASALVLLAARFSKKWVELKERDLAARERLAAAAEEANTLKRRELGLPKAALAVSEEG